MFPRSRRHAWLSGFAGFSRWSGRRTYGERQGLASMVFRGSGLCHQQGQLFLSPILDQLKGFFDGIDDERMFIHAHAAGDFGYLMVSIFIEFNGNLNVVHMHLLNHFYSHFR